MTIKELRKLYPNEALWRASRNGMPNWNYKDEDIVIEYRFEKNHRTVDITNCLFKKNGKPKVLNNDVVFVKWNKVN